MSYSCMDHWSIWTANRWSGNSSNKLRCCRCLHVYGPRVSPPMKLPNTPALRRCASCCCNRYKYLPKSNFVQPWERISCAFRETDRTQTSGERQAGLFDGSGDSDRCEERQGDELAMDRQKESRRRAEIRTKTLVTFVGLLPLLPHCWWTLIQATQPPLCHGVCGPVSVWAC